MKNIILAAFAALALAAAPARAGSQPQRALDECYGKPLAVHVKGWAYDPDVSSQSIDVHVYLYTDSGCTSRYGDIRVLTANVPRPDVNQAKGITGDHGFDADIPVADAGDYWVKVFAIDATDDGNPQVGTTRSVTVAPGFPGSGTDADPYRISSVADWDVFAANVGAGFGSDSRYRLEADIGPVTNRVGASDHPFAGAFDGGGHTLAVAIDGAEAYAAPFSRIDGATISNLVVTGTVAGGIHSAGLVGICGATGPNVIRDCTVAVTVNGSGYAGGIVGHGGSGTLTLDGCVFGGAVNGFNTCAAGLMGWCDALTLTITNCLSKGTFTPSGDGKYHPVACRFANRDVSATVAGAYYLNTIVPTVPGVNPALARTNLIPGAEGTPVSANIVPGEWAQPVTAADGNTYYAWTPAPAGRLLARYSFDDAGNGGLNLLHAAVGSDAIVRATPATPVADIGALAATDASLLSGLAAGDGAVSIPQGQHLAVPIPAALLSASGRPYTVAMKVRVPGDAGWRCLLNMPASNDSDAMVYLHRSDRRLAVKQFDKSDGGGIYSDSAVGTDRWTTLAIAFGENATDAYCDGANILHTDGALAGSYADCVASGGYLLVGADDGTDDSLFHLSDLRIYEGAVAAHILPGSGTPADPYLIASAADWNGFAANVNTGVDSNACYRLAADIGPVTNMVGTAEHPFSGVFDGGSNTLTVALSGSDSFVAPFSAIAGATISNLVVAGAVAGNMHCAGLVGAASGGPNVIENCEVAVAVSSSGTHFGGVIGHGGTNTTTLRGCVFSGSLTGGTHVGTFWGWSDGGSTAMLIDCLDTCASTHPVGRGEGSVCVSNTYYFASTKYASSGKRAYAVTAGEGVAIDFGAPAATYALTGIDAYPTGIRYGGVFYAGWGDAVPMSLSSPPPPFGIMLDSYVASAGTLSRSGDTWTLAMPGENVVVEATWKWSCDGRGTAEDPYLIDSPETWAFLADMVAVGTDTAGLHFRLDADVGPVTNMVGTAEHPFRGTFDGAGHTLTVAISDASSPCAAPFGCTEGATISSLAVAGAVTAPACAGGIVGEARGTLALENCVFSGVLSGFSAQAGGLVGRCGDALSLSVRCCLFAGSFDPAASGTFHPVACRDAGAAVTAAVSRVYYLYAAAPTAAADFLVSDASGEPVSTVRDPDTWYSPVTVAGVTCYRSPPRQVVISSTDDWRAFAAGVNDGFEDYAGRTVVLAADIADSWMVGTEEHPFNGTFDGAGHTIHFRLFGGVGFVAPFRFISGATIMRLKTTGEIYDSLCVAGIVAAAVDGSTNLILGCWSDMDVECYNYGTIAGILGDGRSSSTTVRDCLFTGILGIIDNPVDIPEEERHPLGVIYGGGAAGGTHVVENCLVSVCTANFRVAHYMLPDFAPELLSCADGAGTVSNSYCRMLFTFDERRYPAQAADADSMSSAELAAALGDGWHVSDLVALPAGFESSGGRDLGTCFGGARPFDLTTGILLELERNRNPGVCESLKPVGSYAYYLGFPEDTGTTPTLTTPDGATLTMFEDFVVTITGPKGKTRILPYSQEYLPPYADDIGPNQTCEETLTLVGVGPNVGSLTVGSFHTGFLFNGLPGYYHKDEPYGISSADMLRALAGWVNCGHPCITTDSSSHEVKQIAFALAADIAFDPDDLIYDTDGDGVPDSNFLPIGTADHPFAGIFDGAGHRITGLRCRGGSDAGLFGCNRGTVTGVVVEDAVFSGTNAVGGIAAVNAGTVGKCVVCDSSLSVSEGGAVGAVAGTNGGGLSRNFYDGCSVSGVASPSGVGTASGDADGARPGIRVRGAGGAHVTGVHSFSSCGGGGSDRVYGAPGESLVVTLDDPSVRTAAYTATGGTIAFAGKSGGANGYAVEIPADATPGHIVAVSRDDLWGVDEGRDGTPDHPYVIRSPAGLDLLSSAVNGSKEEQAGVFFELGADIAYPHETAWDDATSTENNYTPIGNPDYCFNGNFDGKNHTISGIRVYTTGVMEAKGLFDSIGAIEYSPCATVKNVIIADARISGTSGVFGGIAGSLDAKNCMIINCHVKADVCFHVLGNAAAQGGITGVNRGVIEHCTSAVKFTGDDGCRWRNCGGIVGWNRGGIVRHCLAFGVTMQSSLNPYNSLGAIVGSNRPEAEYINDGITLSGYTYPVLVHNYYADCMIDGKTVNIGCGTPTNLNTNAGCTLADLNDAENPDGAVPAIILRDGDANAGGLAGSVGQTTNVALYALAAAKGGEWNAICLPFAVGDRAGTPLEGFAVKEFDTATAGGQATGIGDGALRLNFKDAPSNLAAGRPYAAKKVERKIVAEAANMTFDFIRGEGRYTAQGFIEFRHFSLVDGSTNTQWRVDMEDAQLWDDYERLHYREATYGIDLTYGTACEFAAAAPVHVTGYTLVTGLDTHDHPEYNPTNWTLMAKRHLGDAWTVLDRRDATAVPADALPGENCAARSYGVAAGSQGEYLYFRFEMNETRAWLSGYVQLAEFRLQGTYETDAPPGASAFAGVTIGDAPAGTVSSADGKVDFVGSYDPVAFAAGDRGSLLLGPDGALAHPAAATTLGACGAWFRLNGLQAGRDVKGYTLDFGDEILSGAFSLPYDDWATLYGLGAWDAADASGIHNVFRYVFDVPTGAITNPPLLSISFDASGNPVIHTPPFNPAASGFDLSILAYDALTNAVPSATWPLSPTGTNAIPASASPSRFFRLKATEQ